MMRKLFFVIIVMLFMAGCAPQIPKGLKGSILKEYPSAEFIYAEDRGATWCVVYQPGSSKDYKIEQIFNTNSWIPVNQAWAINRLLDGKKPYEGWCHIP